MEEQFRKKDIEAVSLRERNAQLESELEAERKQTEEKLALLVNAKDALTDQFRNLANQIFEDQGTKFVQRNKDSLDKLLQPLGDQIKDFKIKVEDVYDKESKERFSLQGEVKKLVEMNARLSDDATNLTRALKGDPKVQGDWGELILERVLEAAGLVRGREYDVQVSVSKEDGKSGRPDVVIRLPEGKHIIIDSKVSLTAHERYTVAETEDERKVHLGSLVESIRRHVVSLSDQNYHLLHGLKSLDLVIMFVPLESAFRLASEADQELPTDALRKNIVMVGPTNLLVTLKTIATIWRFEYQNRSAKELVRHCSSLYEKFVGFVQDLEDIGKKIDAARISFDDARGKLTSGKGNLLRQVERIRTFGIKPSKALPPVLLELSDDEADSDEPTGGEATPGVAESVDQKGSVSSSAPAPDNVVRLPEDRKAP